MTNQFREAQTTGEMRRPGEIVNVRFARFVSVAENGCRLWQGARIKGYGLFWDKATREHVARAITRKDVA